VLLETYRECLRDVFDMPALAATLADIRSRKTRLVTVDSERPSPFAASLLFSYVASFLYDGDAPLAERRAQALVVDQAQLRELIGDAELRELLDGEAIDAIEHQLQRRDPRYHARTLDAIHDLLLALGDLSAEGIQSRCSMPELTAGIDALVAARRAVPIRVAGDLRYIAVEDAARYRDALGAPLPPGLPESLLEPVRDPLGDLALRYARTHAPFTAAALATRYGLSDRAAESVLQRLAAQGRLLEGEFRPGGSGREWTDAGVLRLIRRRSLAKLRREVEPVDHAVLGRFAVAWQGIGGRRRGADAVLDVVEQLQGAPLPASILESEVLPARLTGYSPADLDALIAAGEIVWVGVESLGERDGRVTLYLADHLAKLRPPAPVAGGVRAEPALTERQRGILDYVGSRGASFFGAIHEAVGGGYPAETLEALWDLVWRGALTNDTFHALRAFTRPPATRRRAPRREAPAFRSRRLVPPSAEGRWSLVPTGRSTALETTRWATATAQQLLTRHGVVTRESVVAEWLPGGFSAVYPVLKAMEERGRVRRGYFIAGLGATQFALPGALDLLRSLRDAGDSPQIAVLAATDPANPYGATLKWPLPASPGAAPVENGTAAIRGRGPTRTVGATIVLVDGALAAYLARSDRQLLTWLPDAEPQRSRTAQAIADALISRAREPDGESFRGMLLEEVDGMPPAAHPLAPHLRAAGFVPGALGFQGVSSR
jgi:ATP-dependent Lhr-like helicase